MQGLISAQQKSVTCSKMVEAGSTVPLYSVEPSFKPLGSQYQKISPYITAAVPHNNSITFKLPPGSGFLMDASLGLLCTYTYDANDAPQAPIGINMIRSIEWLSNGTPIIYKTGSAIFAQFKTQTESSFQKFVSRYCKMLSPVTEAIQPYAAAPNVPTSFLTYCPLMESFLDIPEKYLLLNKINDLQLRVTFNSIAECGLLTAGGITAFTPTLYVETYMPELSVYQEMVVADWSKKLVMQMVNTFTEVFTLTNATSASATFTVPFPVLKTHIFVRGITAAATGGLSQFDITNLTMNLNGVSFLDNYPTSRLNSRAAKHGVDNEAIIKNFVDGFEYDVNATPVITIDWGVLCKRTQNTGVFYGTELRATNIATTISNVGVAANFRLYVCHEFWQNTAFENGVLSIESNN